ncbi:unnamed protein product [Brassica oleracea var. botrytis]
MAEYYSEIVFPDPFESFFTYVCYYLAVHISNLPLGAFLLWCLLSSEAIMTKVDNKDNSVCVWCLKFSDADELKRQLIMVDRQPEEF